MVIRQADTTESASSESRGAAMSAARSPGKISPIIGRLKTDSPTEAGSAASSVSL